VKSFIPLFIYLAFSPSDSWAYCMHYPWWPVHPGQPLTGEEIKRVKEALSKHAAIVRGHVKKKKYLRHEGTEVEKLSDTPGKKGKKKRKVRISPGIAVYRVTIDVAEVYKGTVQKNSETTVLFKMGRSSAESDHVPPVGENRVFVLYKKERGKFITGGSCGTSGFKVPARGIPDDLLSLIRAQGKKLNTGKRDQNPLKTTTKF